MQVGLFLYCLICQLSADCFFLLNIFFGEGVCKVFWLEDLADLDLGFVRVGFGEALDPLDGLFEGLDLPEHEAGDEFLGFGEGTVGDGVVLAGEVDASAFGRGVEALVAEHDSRFFELIGVFVHLGYALGIGEGAFFF